MRAVLESISNNLPVSINYVREHFALDESDCAIRKLLHVAVEHVELQNGISLQKKTWKIIHDNDYIVLGFGPVTKLISIKDANGNELKPISVKRSNDTLIIQMQESDKMTHVLYEAGYDEKSLPDCLKHTVCEKFWELYSENFNTSNDNNYTAGAMFADDQEVVCEKYAFKF